MPERLSGTLGPERVNGKITLWGCFAQHRRDAKKRGIDFFLTFEEWLGIWKASGHLHERGHRVGQYVMARHGDAGPYSIDNVKIITSGENHREGNLGRTKVLTAETRARISKAHKGKTLSPGHRKAIGDGVRGKLKGVPKSLAHRRALSESRKRMFAERRNG